MLAIAFTFNRRVNSTHFETRNVRLDRHRQVSGGIGGGEMNGMTSGRETHGNRRSDDCLTDSPFAEHHDQVVIFGFDLVDQPSQRRQGRL